MQPLPTTVFWPRGCNIEGICYGWSKPAICVAGVIAKSSADSEGPNILSVALSRSELWKAIRNSCGRDPILLGICSFDKISPLPSSFDLFGSTAQLQLSYVLYESHNPQSLRFYVLEPPENEPSRVSHKHDLYSKISTYNFTLPSCHQIDNAINDVVINQINSSALVCDIIRLPLSSSKLLPVTASVLLALASHLGGLATVCLSLSKIVKIFTNAPVNPLAKTETSRKLKDISAIVQQVDVRIEQAVFFINHVTTLNRKNTLDTPSYSIRYTNFFNIVWLMLNDITLGVAFGAYLSENSAELASYTNSAIQVWVFDLPRSAVHWLDAWPAGLKLNAELSRFYVRAFIGVIDTWRHLLPPATPYLFTVLSTLSSVGGLTLALAVLSDLLSFVVTAHLRAAYELSRVVYRGAGVRLGGGLLWGIFRGKRRNILRGRTDTWTYDIDQLLFGTVLFTLIAFLFPTSLAYYALFAGIRLATLLLQASIETMLAFMHHFPLFALLLRIKDSKRLPGGVYFKHKILPGRLKRTYPASHLTLENIPIPLSAIFFQYVELWSRLARHYNPLRLLYQVLAGEHLSSIPGYSIRYAVVSSELPAEAKKSS